LDSIDTGGNADESGIDLAHRLCEILYAAGGDLLAVTSLVNFAATLDALEPTDRADFSATLDAFERTTLVQSGASLGDILEDTDGIDSASVGGALTESPPEVNYNLGPTAGDPIQFEPYSMEFDPDFEDYPLFQHAGSLLSSALYDPDVSDSEWHFSDNDSDDLGITIPTRPSEPTLVQIYEETDPAASHLIQAGSDDDDDEDVVQDVADSEVTDSVEAQTATPSPTEADSPPPYHFHTPNPDSPAREIAPNRSADNDHVPTYEKIGKGIEALLDGPLALILVRLGALTLA
jgi:hypothetical protein